MLTKTVPFWWDNETHQHTSALTQMHIKLHAMQHPPVVRHGHIITAPTGTWDASRRWCRTF